MVAINFTILVDKVRSGEKRQTIRVAKCYDKKCERYESEKYKVVPILHADGTVKGFTLKEIGRGSGVIVCDGCESPKLRYREGMKVQLYTGLRKKGKATLLGRGVITNVRVIRGYSITDANAIFDGFEQGVQLDVCTKLSCEGCTRDTCTPFYKLTRFLKRQYGEDWMSKPYVIINWRLDDG